MFNDYIDVIYPEELKLKTLQMLQNGLIIDRMEFDEDGRLYTRLYDKRDDFDFPIVNLPYLSSTVPESPAYCVFASQLILYARVCSKYEDCCVIN